MPIKLLNFKTACDDFHKQRIRGGKKSSNLLAHPNPLTNFLTKSTYLINGQMGVSPIKPN